MTFIPEDSSDVQPDSGERANRQADEARAVDQLLGNRTVLENLPGRILLLRRDYRILYVNRATPGRAVGEFVGTCVLDHLAEEHREDFREVFEQAWAKGAAGVIELRTKSGLWWEARLAPVARAGDAGYVLCTSDDISARKAAEQALLESEARLRHAIEATGMGTWSYDSRTDDVKWDAALCRIFGVDSADAPRDYDGYLEFVHPDDRGRVAAAIAHNLERGAYEELEHRIVRPGGEVRHVVAKARPVLDAAGRTVGFRGGLLDVTENKRLEEQLGQAQKMEAVGQLTAGIAHNFNNLLAIILPNVQLLRADPGRAGDQRLADIEEAGQRASEMVRQLMLFAGPTGETAHGVVDLVALARRAADACSATFGPRIGVVVDAADGVPGVAGWEPQLEQALLNLLINARDAIVEAAPLSPRISLAVARGPAGTVRLRVTDNGAGMTEATRLRVFEPFFTTKGIGLGTGLGLASAYAIIRQHGGTIRCESRPGAGATFEIELPATEGMPLRVPRSVAPDQASPVTVLLVDDEPLLRRVVRSILEQEGYSVLEAADGHEGVYVFERHHARIGVVILDRSMPGLSGEAAHARLTEIDASVPVVLLSGLSIESWRGSPPALVLAKPTDAATLIDAVRSLAPPHGP